MSENSQNRDIETRSMSENQHKRDIGHDQCPRIVKKRTLVRINVCKFAERRHWSRSMSAKSDNKDIDRDQCLRVPVRKTLIATNVKNLGRLCKSSGNLV